MGSSTSMCLLNDSLIFLLQIKNSRELFYDMTVWNTSNDKYSVNSVNSVSSVNTCNVMLYTLFCLTENLWVNFQSNWIFTSYSLHVCWKYVRPITRIKISNRVLHVTAVLRLTFRILLQSLYRWSLLLADAFHRVTVCIQMILVCTALHPEISHVY